ncbi:MAG: hypothetical protein WD078_10655 [Woeseia sp.]
MNENERSAYGVAIWRFTSRMQSCAVAKRSLDDFERANGLPATETLAAICATEMHYIETWNFTDDTHYVWTLSKKTPDGVQEEMNGTFSRR